MLQSFFFLPSFFGNIYRILQNKEKKRGGERGVEMKNAKKIFGMLAKISKELLKRKAHKFTFNSSTYISSNNRGEIIMQYLLFVTELNDNVSEIIVTKKK